jgi:hypothetical protein
LAERSVVDVRALAERDASNEYELAQKTQHVKCRCTMRLLKEHDAVDALAFAETV